MSWVGCRGLGCRGLGCRGLGCRSLGRCGLHRRRICLCGPRGSGLASIGGLLDRLRRYREARVASLGRSRIAVPIAGQEEQRHHDADHDDGRDKDESSARLGVGGQAGRVGVGLPGRRHAGALYRQWFVGRDRSFGGGWCLGGSGAGIVVADASTEPPVDWDRAVASRLAAVLGRAGVSGRARESGRVVGSGRPGESGRPVESGRPGESGRRGSQIARRSQIARWSQLGREIRAGWGARVGRRALSRARRRRTRPQSGPVRTDRVPGGAVASPARRAGRRPTRVGAVREPIQRAPVADPVSSPGSVRPSAHRGEGRCRWTGRDRETRAPT